MEGPKNNTKEAPSSLNVNFDVSKIEVMPNNLELKNFKESQAKFYESYKYPATTEDLEFIENTEISLEDIKLQAISKIETSGVQKFAIEISGHYVGDLELKNNDGKLVVIAIGFNQKLQHKGIGSLIYKYLPSIFHTELHSSSKLLPAGFTLWSRLVKDGVAERTDEHNDDSYSSGAKFVIKNTHG